MTSGKQHYGSAEYQSQLAVESKKWGDHLAIEATGEWNAWLDHPLILEHYRRRSLLDGLNWQKWVKQQLGGPAERSLDLGCGTGQTSLFLFEEGASAYVVGQDISEARIDEAEKRRIQAGIPGNFYRADTNMAALPPRSFDIIFSCHSFHHFLDIEYIMRQVHEALTPGGFFVLEEFVGPSQFQWTDQQIDLVRSLMAVMPERLRHFRNGEVKSMEGRPTPDQVVAVSPFESIRSAEIVPVFQQFFDLVAVRALGGTIQHLLYNGIASNLRLDDEEAIRYLRAVMAIEDTLIDSQMLPSDFMLLIGRPAEG